MISFEIADILRLSALVSSLMLIFVWLTFLSVSSIGNRSWLSFCIRVITLSETKSWLSEYWDVILLLSGPSSFINLFFSHLTFLLFFLSELWLRGCSYHDCDMLAGNVDSCFWFKGFWLAASWTSCNLRSSDTCTVLNTLWLGTAVITLGLVPVAVTAVRVCKEVP